MTISSALNAGVTGLSVNASRLATISDNIANSATFGYKRAEAEFSSMVVSSTKGSYTAGGVRSATTREVTALGSLATTTNALDIAVSGRGMLPTTTASAATLGESNPPLLLTRTGSFRPDENGLLRTASGLALLGWPADPGGDVPDNPRDSIAGLEPVRIFNNQFAASPTENIGLGVNLPAVATQASASGDTLVVPIEYFDNVGASQTLTTSFTPTIPAAGSSNTWTMTIEDTATDAASNPIAEVTLVFDDSRGSGGSLLSVTPVAGATYDALTGVLAVTVEGGPMNVNVGTPGSTDKLTQLSAEFTPVPITKDGSQVGTLSSVEFDENGFLNAIYDTGFIRTIYQVPIADVPNHNGLKAEDGQAYSLTAQSGSLYLWDSGAGPTGQLIGYALEESTTDIAGELTALIETQRAYSSNAKIIQTVDEMLQETTNIKR